MKKIAALLVLAAGTVANADVVLNVDTSVLNQVTITATAANSSATASGSTFDGYLLGGFFTLPGALGSTQLGTSTLTPANVASNGSAVLFRSGNTDAGLNIYNYSGSGTTTFTSGALAFSGSVTYTLTPAAYAIFLSSNAGGNVYFAADDSSDIPNAQVVGQWRVVPTPGAAAVLGLGGLALGRRRRA